MLKEAGYDNTPVVLMRPTDLASIAKIPLVAKQQLEAAGFKVDFQQMDWATLLARRAKKDAPANGGWSAFLTAWTAGDISNPLTIQMFNAKGQMDIVNPGATRILRVPLAAFEGSPLAAIPYEKFNRSGDRRAMTGKGEKLGHVLRAALHALPLPA
mgnify:CR=1 FL=1